MSKLSEKVAYLRGLAEGLKLDEKDNNSKLISELICALDLASQQLNYVEEQVEDLADYVDEVDRDLSEVEDYLVEESDCDCDCDEDEEEDDDYSYYPDEDCDCDDNCDENCNCSCHQ